MLYIGQRFGGYADNDNCAPRNENCNNEVGNANVNYGGSAHNPNRKKYIKNRMAVVPRSGKCYKTKHVTRETFRDMLQRTTAAPRFGLLKRNMQRHENIYERITLELFKTCAVRAAAEHLDKDEVIKFMVEKDMNCEWLFYEFINGTYERLLKYRQLKVVNPNGKTRNIDAPDFITRIYQYVFLELIEPIYYEKDPNTGLNCKPGHGITAEERKNSVVKKLKHIYYDCRNYECALVTDQRQCYQHMKIHRFRRMLRRMVKDERFVDYAVKVCYVGGRLPVGTPTSPLIHHIMMLPFDLWLNNCVSSSIRYADDVFVPCETLEEAQRLKWRIKNVWWYTLGIRAKRGTTRIVPMRLPTDFCGYIPHRNKGRKVCDHDKGYVTLRSNTFDKACKADNKNWGSYFGIMVHADLFREMCRIEKEMDLKKLTEKIKINRAMDAPSIMPKELADRGIVFTIYDYEIRKDTKGVPNWIKCLIGYPEINEDGEETGKIIAREFHGGYLNLIQYHLLLEAQYPKKQILPLSNCEIENSCGYIYKNSTNQIKFIENEENQKN